MEPEIDGDYVHVTIGLMLPLAPATAIWTLPFGAYFVFLSTRVASLRLKTQELLGDHVKPAPHTRSKTEFGGGMNKTELGGGMNKMELGSVVERGGVENTDDPDPLYLANRCLANYLETVPMAMIISVVAELNGANRRLMNYALGTLLLLKVAHIELGLRRAWTKGVGRLAGCYGDQGWIAGMVGYGVYLVKDHWWA